MSLNIDLIRTTFDKIKPQAAQFADYFYDRLFNDFPSTKEFFKNTNFAVQKKALINSLVTVVDSIDQSGKLVKPLKALGARHLQWDVREEHYGPVGETLLATLEHFLGSDWNDQTKEEWTQAYIFIRDTMLEGAAEESQKLAKVYEITQKKSESGASSSMGNSHEMILEKVIEIVNREGFEFPVGLEEKIREEVRAILRDSIVQEIENIVCDELKQLQSAPVETYFEEFKKAS